MKKNNFFVLLSIVLIVIFCGLGILGYAQSQDWIGRKMPETISKREDAEPQKTITANENKSDSYDQKDLTIKAQELSDTLTYSYTDSFDAEKPIDIYVDEKNGQYRYNQSGRLLNYYNTEYNLLNKPTHTITKKQAGELALVRLKAFYGSSMDAAVLESCEIATAGSFPGQYEVKFEKRGGKNDFIFISGITVYVSLDGEILAFSASSSDKLESFDIAILEGIAEEDLQAWAKKQIVNSASNPFSQCKEADLIFSYDISFKDENAFIRVLAVCEANDHGHPNQTYLYEL